MDTRTFLMLARQLADRLLKEPNCRRQDGEDGDDLTCWSRENDRCKPDGSKRYFREWQAERLCLPCQAAWYAAMTARVLERLEAMENQDARTKR